MAAWRRLVLPLALLVACIAAFVFADRLGSNERATAPAGDDAILDTPLFSVRRQPEAVVGGRRDRAVTEALPEVPGDLSALSCHVVLVDGEIVQELRGDQELSPGLAQLLLTAHTALEELPGGPDHTFETAVLGPDKPDEDGVVPGGLWLIGGGDPVLMTFAHSRSFRPVLSAYTPFEDLAEAVVDAGVRIVEGGVTGVERRYDDQRLLPGWPLDAVESGRVGPMSALQVNDGLTERAAANDGVAVGADRPALFAAGLLDDLLEDRGVSIPGLSTEPAPDAGLPDLVPIASITSPPLSEIVFQMLAVSDATAAEMLLKEIGFERSSVGSTERGAETVVELAASLGIDLGEPPRDASGLDQSTTLSCRTLAAFADAIPTGHPTLDVLPGHDLPAVFDGRLGDVELAADLRVVGGVSGRASGLVGRTVQGETRITIATIVNRTGGPNATDLVFQADLLTAVDELVLADPTSALQAAVIGDG